MTMNTNTGMPTMTPMVDKVLTMITAPFLMPIMIFPHWESFVLSLPTPNLHFSVQGWEATNDP